MTEFWNVVHNSAAIAELIVFVGGIPLLLFNTTIQEWVKSKFMKQTAELTANLARANIKFQINESEFIKARVASINDLNGLMLKAKKVILSYQVGDEKIEDLLKTEGDMWDAIMDLRISIGKSHIYINPKIEELIVNYERLCNLMRSLLIMSHTLEKDVAYMETAYTSFVSGQIKLEGYRARRGSLTDERAKTIARMDVLYVSIQDEFAVLIND